MNKQEIILNAQKYVHEHFSDETTGHDYYHLERVVKLAKKIANEETGADLFLIELAAWLHDLGDHKLNAGIDRTDELVTDYLKEMKVPESVISEVVKIISQVSFSQGKTASSLEAKIVQDADRLDALGAIGIARCFAYGGKKNRQIWNPENPGLTSIQHFYDKLLKLKDLMNTETAKKIANRRHQFLEEYLKEFYKEWEGE